MKILVVILAFLAAAKVGYQEYLVRSATHEVIVLAYRDRAISACQRDAVGLSLVSAGVWSQPQRIRLVIGKSNMDVFFWQTDHVLWNARYRNPYLVLSAVDKPGNFSCEYDVVHGATSVVKL